MREGGKRPANAIGMAAAPSTVAKVDRVTHSISGRYVRPRQRATPRQFSDEDKAKVVAVAACITEVGQNEIGKIFGLNRRTISEWTRGIYISDKALAMADEHKERIKAKFENILELALDVMPEKVDKASFWDLARASGLAFDKIQLMEGKPTVISGNELPSNERARMIFALMAQAKQRQDEAEIIDITPTDSGELVRSPLEASNNDANESEQWEPI